MVSGHLYMYGHADVALMNGGRKKWELEGRSLTTDAPQIKESRYQAKDVDLTFRAYMPANNLMLVFRRTRG